MLESNDLTESLIIENEVCPDDEPPGKPIQQLVSKNNVQHFRSEMIPGILDEEWNDWHWQIKNSFRKLSQLEKFFGLSLSYHGVNENKDILPLRITPYYASLIDFNNPDDPLYKCVVPSTSELHLSRGESSDPLHENNDSPVKNLVHRYPDRALFLVTGFCSTYCRYCTRSHMVAKQDKAHFGLRDYEDAFKYIESHSEIRDVILSGGDPLTMVEEKLEYILSRLRNIPHIEIIRIGTKVPAVLPQRITQSLADMLSRYHPLMISIHFTHPNELTAEVKQACERLANAGIPLGSQTVLLKGINDDAETMKKLMHGLLRIRVRPYYLYQCDPILGSSHFRTTVNKGLEVIKGLRGFTSGYAVPTYVIDAPGGGGKIPVLPDYNKGYEGEDLLLENYSGNIYRYPDYCVE